VLGVLAALGVIQLAVTQLAGDGKLALLVLPLFAVILIGPRAGWWMVVLSSALFMGVAWLTHNQMLTGVSVVEGLNSQPGFWWLQGFRLTTHMVVLTLLLTQFHALQWRTMIAERTALRKLEAETADRKRLEAEVAHVSELERRNLGSELHDGLCQNLTAALLNCTALENRHSAAGSPDAEDVACIREMIEESIDTAYDVARGLCPLGLGAEGLVSGLEGLCRAVNGRRGISCELQVEGDVTIADPDRALQLYRIAGEALTNAVKHAECKRIMVRLAGETGRLELSVADDGKGIPPDGVAGLGRRIMAYRAGLIEGALTVSGVPGQGTTVTCRISDAGGTA
jgi:signal transduction histidine kinase